MSHVGFMLNYKGVNRYNKSLKVRFGNESEVKPEVKPSNVTSLSQMMKTPEEKVMPDSKMSHKTFFTKEAPEVNGNKLLKAFGELKSNIDAENQMEKFRHLEASKDMELDRDERLHRIKKEMLEKVYFTHNDNPYTGRFILETIVGLMQTKTKKTPKEFRTPTPVYFIPLVGQIIFGQYLFRRVLNHRNYSPRKDLGLYDEQLKKLIPFKVREAFILAVEDMVNLRLLDTESHVVDDDKNNDKIYYALTPLGKKVLAEGGK